MSEILAPRACAEPRAHIVQSLHVLPLGQACGVTVLSVAYLAASVMLTTREIVEVNDVERSSSMSEWWEFPELLFNLTFLIWIYLALSDTMNKLYEQRERWAHARNVGRCVQLLSMVLLLSLLTTVRCMVPQLQAHALHAAGVHHGSVRTV